MTEFTDIEGQEIWIHGRRVGIIVENWFYPVPGVRLAGFELEEITKEMAYQDSPLHSPGVETPADTKRESSVLDKKSIQQAKDQIYKRPVENDQSDAISRAMKPSGGL